MAVSIAIASISHFQLEKSGKTPPIVAPSEPVAALLNYKKRRCVSMGKQCTPEIFRQLESEGYITGSDILRTEDGFWAIYKSLSDILENKGIYDFPGSKGIRLACNKFYDDWFIYAVPDEDGYVYSLLKLREQEHDAMCNSPADGDTPGVTISFISFACEMLLDCLAGSAV